MAVPIIQGINRIRLRKTIDEAGNCDPCHIYLPLSPENKLSDAIERHIAEAMPDLKFNREWDFLQLPKTDAVGQLVECLRELGPGEHTRAATQQASGKGKRQFARMVREFKLSDAPGITYERRRGGCVFIVEPGRMAA